MGTVSGVPVLFHKGLEHPGRVPGVPALAQVISMSLPPQSSL